MALFFSFPGYWIDVNKLGNKLHVWLKVDIFWILLAAVPAIEMYSAIVLIQWFLLHACLDFQFLKIIFLELPWYLSHIFMPVDKIVGGCFVVEAEGEESRIEADYCSVSEQTEW